MRSGLRGKIFHLQRFLLPASSSFFLSALSKSPQIRYRYIHTNLNPPLLSRACAGNKSSQKAKSGIHSASGTRSPRYWLAPHPRRRHSASNTLHCFISSSIHIPVAVQVAWLDSIPSAPSHKPPLQAQTTCFDRASRSSGHCSSIATRVNH